MTFKYSNDAGALNRRKKPGFIDFEQIANEALYYSEGLVRSWLPDGRQHGDEYVARNPRRIDHSPGSFWINLDTGRWGDFAIGRTGGDLISLYAYLNDCSQREAALALAHQLNLENAY